MALEQIDAEFVATNKTRGFHATHPDVAPLIRENGFRQGTAPGRNERTSQPLACVPVDANYK